MLDRTDFEILDLLQNDVRLSNKELAARVKLAPSTALERVRRLREKGVLRGAHADVAPDALAIGLQAMIAVQLRQHSRKGVEAFNAHAIGLREVRAVYHLAGANDFLVHVAVRDAEHLGQFALDEFASRSEVRHLETALIFGYEHTPVLPNYADE